LTFLVIKSSQVSPLPGFCRPAGEDEKKEVA